MKAGEMYSERAIINVFINGELIWEFGIRTDDKDITTKALTQYINENKFDNEEIKIIAEKIKSYIAGKVIKDLIWEEGYVAKILREAFENASTDEVKQNIRSMQIQILPMLKNIQDPSLNTLSKINKNKFWGLSTYDQVITAVLSKNLVQLGTMTFTAKLEA